MKKLTLALALVGAAGLVAGCGGEGGDSGPAPEAESGENALTQPIKKAEDLAGDLQDKAAEAGDAMGEERTVMLSVTGMS